MRFYPSLSPLIFEAFSADALLDILNIQKDGKGTSSLTVYGYNSRYYIAAEAKLKDRRLCREFLRDFGTYINSSPVTAAFLEEHGKLLHAGTQLLR